MEAYKNEDALGVMQAQMEILSDFPSQVLVLKGTAAVCGLRGRKAGLRRRLIDQDQTAGFAAFCRHLRQATHDQVIRRSIEKYAATARSHIDKVTKDMIQLMDGIVDMAEIYDARELAILRSGAQFTDQMIEKFTRYSLLLAVKLHSAHPNSQRAPSKEEMPNTFLFRAAVCMQLIVLRWAEDGRKSTRPDKLRNDIIDSNFATYATFFDGLFTDDRRAQELYSEAKVTLSAIVPSELLA